MAKRKKKASAYDLEYLKKMAHAGAEATLHKLRQEIDVIERTFPELSTSKGRGKAAAAAGKQASRMTAAGRKAVSARMRKYWAERRKVTKAAAKK